MDHSPLPVLYLSGRFPIVQMSMPSKDHCRLWCGTLSNYYTISTDTFPKDISGIYLGLRICITMRSLRVCGGVRSTTLRVVGIAPAQWAWPMLGTPVPNMQPPHIDTDSLSLYIMHVMSQPSQKHHYLCILQTCLLIYLLGCHFYFGGNGEIKLNGTSYFPVIFFSCTPAGRQEKRNHRQMHQTHTHTFCIREIVGRVKMTPINSLFFKQCTIVHYFRFSVYYMVVAYQVKSRY